MFYCLLKENKYEEIVEALYDEKIEWKYQGPANKRYRVGTFIYETNFKLMQLCKYRDKNTVN